MNEAASFYQLVSFEKKKNTSKQRTMKCKKRESRKRRINLILAETFAA